MSELKEILTVEKQLISACLRSKEDYLELIRSAVDAESFSKSFSKIFLFIKNFYDSYGGIPSEDTIIKETGFRSVEAVEPIAYYIEKLFQKNAFDEIDETIQNAKTFMDKGEVLYAIEAAQTGSKRALKKLNVNTNYLSIDDVEPLLERYEAIKNKDSRFYGYDLPWEKFNEQTQGLKKGEYMLVAARPGVGKTWLAVQLANSFWVNGANVLFVSMEIDPELIALRHVSYVSKIPFSLLHKGKLDPYQEDKFKKTLDELTDADGFDIIGYNMSSTITHIEANIEKHKPDVLIVDGAYLVNPPNSSSYRSRNEKMEFVATAMSTMATSFNIGVVNTLQLNREQKSNSISSDLANLYGSDSWAQNADYVFSMTRSNKDKEASLLRISALKHRNGDVFASKVYWDLEAMCFEVLEFEVGTTILDKENDDIDFAIVNQGLEWQIETQ